MTMRTGIIGTGFWASQTHAPVVAAHPDLQLTGVWGRDPARTASLAADFETNAFTDIDALLDSVEAVILTVPPTAQPDLAIRAARAGVHLLLEKPLALSLEDAVKIRDEVEAHDVAALVFFTSRYRPEQRAWMAAARDRGGWHSGHASWLATTYAPDAPRDMHDWRQAKGGLWDVGPHALSVALGVLGPVSEVAATKGSGDTVHLAMRHQAGDDGTAPSSTVTVSLTAPLQQSLFSAVGTAGHLTMPTPLSTPRTAAVTALTDLARMVQTGERTHEADLRLGVEVVEVLTTADRALEQRRVVAVDEVRGVAGAL